MTNVTIVRQLPVGAIFTNEFGTFKVMRHGRALGTLIQSTAAKHKRIITDDGDMTEFDSPAGAIWVGFTTPVDTVVSLPEVTNHV